MKKRCLLTIILAVCSVLIFIPFTGCAFKGYSGEYPDLYTVAINSILWNWGHIQQLEGTAQPIIGILEKDDYGRTLYVYYEGSGAETNLVISQYSEEDYVYYYEDFNFLQKDNRSAQEGFSQEEVDNLKSLNDWGKEIDLKKCVKKQITRKKQSIPCDEKIIEEKAVQKFNEKGERYNINTKYLTSDNLGNFLVYGYIWLKDESNIHIFFVMFIDADCERFDFFVPSERYSYQEELKNFKVENGWVS